MSCQFRTFAKIADIPNIKRTLFLNNSNIVSSGDGNDPWDWSIEEKPDNKETWLEECLISLSPTSELLVLATKKNLVILTAKWDSMEESDAKTKYVISWHGDPRRELNETITSILCLPVAASGRQSSHSGADWTCIAVGFSSGAIRFYTETGSLLVSEILHDDTVVNIKCQCFQPARNGTEPQQLEELYVIYTNVVSCVRGLSLCNTLKACRNQLARVQANCGDRVEAPPLDQIKWSLVDQVAVADMSVIGSQAANAFTHLTTASTRGGFDASYRSSPPHTATVLATGTRPYIAFHCIVEGASAPALTDVAKAVATRFKSAFGQAVPSWLGRSRRNSLPDKNKEKPPLEPPEAMACRFGLCDAMRHGTKVYICPQRRLSAVCDSLGRVILVDISSGIAVRMWKGYREAECAFLPVYENKGSGRCALFLSIYAPKKGIIEVWALQQGPKVVTFPATKTGRLMYINHGLLGVNSLTIKSSNCSQHPCVFIDNSGTLSQIFVPFHSILSDKNDKRSRDMHILKLIKRALHGDIDEVKDLCNQLNTDEMCEQALDMVASSKYTTPDLLQQIVSIFLDKLTAEELESKGQYKERCLQACKNIQKLLDFYTMVHVLQSQPPKYNTVVPTSPEYDKQGELAQLLKLTEKELHNLLMFVSSSDEHKDLMKVTFKQAEDIFSVFISCFLQSCTKPPPITLSSNVSQITLANIGEICCQCILYGSSSIEEWKSAAVDSNIEPKAFLHAAISYWLSKPHGNNLHSEFTLFNQLITAICSLANVTELDSWWPEIRSRISASDNPSNALTAAILVRAVFLSNEAQLFAYEDKSDTEWETVSEESCSWTMIISQLEAIAQLHEVMMYKARRRTDTATVCRLDYVNTSISLSQILSKGPGSISELVAKWISSWGIPPEWLVEAESSVTHPNPCTSGSVIDGIPAKVDPSSEVIPTTKSEDMVLQRLKTLQEHYPHSLSSSPLIANLAWEYVLAWTKDLDNVELLGTSLKCVNTISNHHLKQGMCSIIWNVHLRNKFEATVKLLHKIGKVPKDRLCRQDVNISDINIKYFLRCVVEFFNIFIEACTACETCERKPIQREALWTEDTQPSLAEVAIAQVSPNCGLLHILSQCASALHLLSTFSLHFHRPITNLFDSVGESCIWNDIASNPRLPVHNFEPKLQEMRTKFLIKVMNAALEPLCPNSEEVTIKESVNWISQCYTLATDWALNFEPLRRNQVCQLYLQNCDRFAEDVVPALSDQEALGIQLLHVAGQKMKTVLQNSNLDLKERMANLSPSLTLWIRQLDGTKSSCDLKSISQLSALVVSLIPESNPDHRLAVLLSEALQPLAV